MPRLMPLLATALAGAALVAPAAQAFGTSVPCQTRTERQVFAPWGDAGWYFQVPNAGFESGTTDWSLSGSAIVTENEPWKVRASTDARSLRLPAGSSARSRTICVRRGEDIVRFFVKRPNVSSASLKLEIKVWNRVNLSESVNTYAIGGAGSGWTQSPAIRVSDLGGDVDMELVLTATGGTFQVDDVYVDPYRST